MAVFDIWNRSIHNRFSIVFTFQLKQACDRPKVFSMTKKEQKRDVNLLSALFT